MKETILKASREARMHPEYPHELQTDLYDSTVCHQYLNNYDQNHHIRMNGRFFHDIFHPKAGCSQFMRRLRDAKNRWDARKKGHAQDNMKIIYRHFVLQLFSHTIISSLITRGNPIVSCIITASTVRWFERRDTRNLSREAA